MNQAIHAWLFGQKFSGGTAGDMQGTARDLALSKCHIGISPSGQKMGLWDQSQCHVQSIVGIDPNVMKKRVLGSVPMSCTGCNWD